MIIIVDYEFYKDIYHGKSVGDYSDFEILSRKALSLVRLHTFNRVDSVNDEEMLKTIKFTICELISVYSHESSRSKAIKSESTGEHSVNYFSSSESGNNTDYSSVLYEILYRNLINTGLLYRGV